MEFEVDIRSRGLRRRVTFPTNYHVLERQFGFDISESEYEIEEYFFPFYISVSPSIEKLNDVAFKLREIPKYMQNMQALQNIEIETGYNFDEFIENINSMRLLEGKDATELGHYLRDFCKMEPANINDYFDYKSFGEDYLSKNVCVKVSDGFITFNSKGV